MTTFLVKRLNKEDSSFTGYKKLKDTMAVYNAADFVDKKTRADLLGEVQY